MLVCHTKISRAIATNCVRVSLAHPIPGQTSSAVIRFFYGVEPRLPLMSKIVSSVGDLTPSSRSHQPPTGPRRNTGYCTFLRTFFIALLPKRLQKYGKFFIRANRKAKFINFSSRLPRSRPTHSRGPQRYVRCFRFTKPFAKEFAKRLAGSYRFPEP
jgi:hypothetical protein